MKTAQDYIKAWNLPEAKTIGDQDWKTSIEVIQLDAFKAGAEWAAKMALKSFEHLDNDFNLAGKVISGDLEMASSNLKEIPK